MRLKFIIAAISATLVFGACSSPGKLLVGSDTKLNAYTEGRLSYQSQHRFKFLFLEAQRLKALEEYEKATTMVGQCLAIDPLNADAHYEMALLSVRVENIQDAIFHAEQSKNLNPKNTWTLELLSQLYQNTGNTEKLLENCKELSKLSPSNIDYQYCIASSYTSLGDYKKALSIYNELEKTLGLNEEISIIKEHLYIQMGNVDMAAEELKKLIAAFPYEVNYQKMLAELYHANDLTKEAIDIYNEILKKDPSDSHANSSLAEFYRLKGDYLKAFEYLTRSFDDPEFNLEVMVQVLSSYFELALENEIYESPLKTLLDKAILNHPNQAIFHVFAGDLSFQKNESEDAYEAYKKALSLNISEFFVWNRYLMLGLDLNKYESICSEGQKSINTHPVQPTLYLFTGFGCSLDNQKEKAIEIWNKGLNYVVNNPTLKAEFYSYLGDAYHSLEEHSSSDANFERSLKIIPENPLVLNNYSYYLSLRSENLEKAERMSKKSNELVPDEPTYQDTYGWVLFKMGRFIESEEWIRKALEKENNNAEILEHYGDVLYRLDRKKEAVSYWKKAKEKGGDSKNLIKKLEEGELYE